MSHLLKTQLKAKAQELGFSACGVAAAGESHTTKQLTGWLEAGYHADMAWMGRPDAVSKRADITLTFPGVKSVLVVAQSYRTHEPWDPDTHANVARYARGQDYHDTLTARLRQLLAWLQTQTTCEGRVYVDTGPVLEREWAQRAGLGWIGKNTLLMSREMGSYVLLGELLLDIELPPDRPHLEEFCGTCTRCLDACPTNAFVAPRVLDANRCISYHTIENRKVAPKDVREKVNDWVFGCDICQEVCPWNHKAGQDEAAYSPEPHLWTRPEMPTLLEWLLIPQAEFSARLKGSPIKRTKRRGMRRNAARVLRNRRRNQP